MTKHETKQCINMTKTSPIDFDKAKIPLEIHPFNKTKAVTFAHASFRVGIKYSCIKMQAYYTGWTRQDKWTRPARNVCIVFQ